MREIMIECKCCNAVYYIFEEKCPVCGYDEDLDSVSDYSYIQAKEYLTDDLRAVYQDNLTEEEINQINKL